MSYIGPAPNPGQNREVDDISSGFNGGTAAFTLQVNGQNVSPGSSNNIIVSLGGVIQNPGTDYTIAGSTITFTTNPASGLSFFGLVLGQQVDIQSLADGTSPTMSAPSITGDLSIADKIVHTGDTNTAIRFPATDEVAFETSGSERLRVKSTGKVGIGTNNPAALFSINENNASEHFQLTNSTNTSNFTAFGVDTSFNLRLYVNQSERRRVLSTGRFLFGRTTEFVMGSDAVDYQFEQLTNDAYTLGIHANNTNQRGIGMFYTSGKTADPFLLTRVDTSLKCIIRGDGDLENANNSYGSISDISMKENIVDANSQWNDIKNIKVRNYNFKESTGQQTHTQIGVIAQELETVSPKLVRVSEDEIKTVSYSILYMKAVKALQEAQTRIETLETKVAALEAA